MHLPNYYDTGWINLEALIFSDYMDIMKMCTLNEIYIFKLLKVQHQKFDYVTL